MSRCRTSQCVLLRGTCRLQLSKTRRDDADNDRTGQTMSTTKKAPVTERVEAAGHCDDTTMSTTKKAPVIEQAEAAGHCDDTSRTPQKPPDLNNSKDQSKESAKSKQATRFFSAIMSMDSD